MKRTTKRFLFAAVLTIIVFAILFSVWIINEMAGIAAISLGFVICFFRYATKAFDWLIAPDPEEEEEVSEDAEF